jgi:hypothetical protein
MPSQEQRVRAGNAPSPAVYAGRPTIHTVIDGEEADIELQTSAVLAMNGSRLKAADAASDRTDLAVAAAKRLYRAGFYDRTACGLQIIVTALDL